MKQLYTVPKSVLLLIYFLALLNSQLFAQTLYYSSGNANNPAASHWKTNRDGTGSSPTLHTANNQIFVIQEGHTITRTSALTISGTNSRYRIESGGTMVSSANNTCTVEIQEGGTWEQSGSYTNLTFYQPNNFKGTFLIKTSNLRWTIAHPSLHIQQTGTTQNPGNTSITIHGDLIIEKNEFRGTSTGSPTHTIGGSIRVIGGTSSNKSLFRVTDGSGAPTFNVGGGIYVDAGSDNEITTASGISKVNFTGTNEVDVYWTENTNATKMDITIPANKKVNWYRSARFGEGSVEHTFTVNGHLALKGSATRIYEETGGTDAAKFVLNSGATLEVEHTSGLRVSASVGAITVQKSRTFNSGAKIIYSGTSDQVTGLGGVTFSTANTIANLEVNKSSGTLTTDGDLIVSNSLIMAGNITNPNTRKLNINGTFSRTSGTLTNNTGGTIEIGGSGAQLPWPAGITSVGGNFILDRANGMSTSGSLTLTNTTFTNGSITFNGQALTINGIIAGTGGGLIGNNSSNLTIGGTNQAISAISTPDNLNNLTINATTGRTLVLSQNLTVANACSLGLNTLNINDRTLTVNGSGNSLVLTSAGALTNNTASKLVFGTQAGNSNLNTNITSFNGEIEINRAGTLTLVNNLTVEGAISLTSGNLLLNGNILTLNGNLNRTSGNLSGTSTSKLIINGSGTPSGELSFASGARTLNQLTINRGGSGIVTLATDLSLQNTGGFLDIQNGTLSDGGNNLSGTASASLTMSGGELRLLNSTNNQPNFSGTFNLTGGTINLAANSNQTLAGARTYKNLTFSGSGTKSITSGISGSNHIDGTVTIQDNAILDVSNFSFGGGYSDLAISTNFTMTGGRFRTSHGSNPVPRFEGTYNLSAGTVELYGTGSSTSMTLNAGTGKNYFNVEINANASNLTPGASAAGNVIHGAGNITIEGTMTIKSPAVYAIGGGNYLVGAGNFVVENGAGLIYGDANGITPNAAGTGTSAGNIRTTSRTFNTGATYGMRGSVTGQNSGAGLPSTIASLIIQKTSGGSVNLTNATIVSSELSLQSGELSNSNLTIGSSCTISRTGGSISGGLPTFSTGYSVSYPTHSSSLTVGNEIGATTVNNLTILNANGVTSNKNFTVSGSINTQNGKLTINPSNVVTLGNSASLVNEQGSNYVVGRIATTRTVGILPNTFGNLGFELSGGAQDLGNVTVERKSGSGFILSGLGNASIARNYDILITGEQPTSGRTLTFKWLAEEDNSKDFSSKNAMVFMREYPSDPFKRLSPWNAGFKPVTISGPERSITAVTTHFSEFTVSDEDNPLPVDLAYFLGNRKDSDVVLSFKTLSEKDNKGFYIERSFDGNIYESLGFVKGAGNSYVPQTYSFLDQDNNKEAYYRLIQEDFDGTKTLHNVVYVRGNNGNEVAKLITYPNPFNNELNVLDNDEGQEKLIIRNSTGVVVRSEVFEGQNSGATRKLNLSELPKGLYFITKSNLLGENTLPLVKE